MKINNKQIYYFFIIPLFINLILLGFYFSGIKFLQQIIAPTISFLHFYSWREFGLLEQLQNIYLISIFVLFLYSCITRQDKKEKIFFFVLACLFLFLFLEEIDYGLHIYEFITGQYSGLEIRNWHNQKNGKHDNVHFLKLLVDIITILWFVVLPLLADKIKIPIIKCMIPSRYFVAGFILTFLLSRLTHFLNDQGFSIIDGVKGNLFGNLSEFREQNTYYFYLLYAIQIIKTKLTFSWKP